MDLIKVTMGAGMLSSTFFEQELKAKTAMTKKAAKSKKIVLGVKFFKVFMEESLPGDNHFCKNVVAFIKSGCLKKLTLQFTYEEA